MHEIVPGLVPVLGRVLLHFLWQGALIGLLAAVALQLLAGARPQARYAVACLAMLACVLAPLGTLLLGMAGMGGGVDAAPALATPGMALLEPAAPATVQAPSFVLGLGQLPGIEPALPWIVAAWAACACTLSRRLAAGVWWLGR